MTTLSLIVWGILVLAVVLMHAIRPIRSHHSWFELKRRGDEKLMHREKLLDDVYAYIRFFSTVLIILLTAVSVSLWQWWGVAASVIVTIVALLIGKSKPIQRTMTRAYSAREHKILELIEKFSFIAKILGSEKHTPHDQRLESVDQLLHLVDSAGHVLSPDQQRIIKQSVHWHDRLVGDIMTPRGSIVPIKHDELLGPLVLDDLHRSGFSRFPVIDGHLDNVVGILNISDLLEIDGNRRSHVVEKIMSPQVLRIKADDTLPVALKMLQKSQQNVIIVVDDEGITEGILTLSDITGSILGK